MKRKFLYGVTVLCIVMGLAACSKPEEKTQPETGQLVSEEPVRQETVKQEPIKQETVKEEPVEKGSVEEEIMTPAEEWLYTFEKCSPDLLPEERWNLLNINDMDIAGYIDEECLTIGRVITRFGEPDYVRNDMEDLYNCAVSATDRTSCTLVLGDIVQLAHRKIRE